MTPREGSMNEREFYQELLNAQREFRDEFRRTNDALGNMATIVERLEAQQESMSEQIKMLADLLPRIQALETEQIVTDRLMTSHQKTIQWVIGTAVGIILALIGIIASKLGGHS